MNQKHDMATTKIALFRGEKIRKTIHDNEWWFSVIDVVGILANSSKPRDYWYKMKTRVRDEESIELSTICRQLKLESTDGKNMVLTVRILKEYFA